MPNNIRRLVLPALLTLLVGCSGARYAPDFTLHDDNASRWTLSQQRGKIVLLTFGYTHCVDSCPATLGKLAHVMRSLKTSAGSAEIVFATIDPQRDTVAVLHRYVARFRKIGASPVIGLTGTRQEIASVERAYHIWSQRIGGRSYGEAHSAAIVLIDRNGRIRGVRDDDDSDAQILNAVSEMLA